MTSSVELQVISKILTTDSSSEIDRLCAFDESYYAVFKEHIRFILEHRQKYGDVPDVFTFQSQFEDIVLVQVDEPIQFLEDGLRKNKQQILLLETFNKLSDLGSADVSEAWEYLSNQVDRVSELDTSQPLNIVKDADKRANQILEFNKQKRIPTGFKQIDKCLYGGLSTVEELLVIIARTNSGKAQPLWSKVLTPAGWKTMGEVQIGDTLIGKNNDNGKVIQIFPQGVKDYYRVHFDDGTYAECCDDHLWEVLSDVRRQRSNKSYGVHEVLQTSDIRNTLHKNYSVDVSEPIEFQSNFDADSELDGYLLGVILGDGGTRDGAIRITNQNKDIWDRLESIISQYGCKRSGKLQDYIVGQHRVNPILSTLKSYGLIDKKSVDKFIPKQYLTAPVSVRKALLSGLVDTDGYISKDSKQVWEFDTASEQLAADFVELARSLGVKVKVYPKHKTYYTDKSGNRVECSGNYHIVCRSIFNPFYTQIKACRYDLRTTVKNRSMPKRHCKMIRSIEYVGKTECQCILLDNESHTYITDGYTVTHNSWVCTKMMESAQANGFPVLFYSPEMQSCFIGARFDTWRSHFKNSDLFRGNYTEEYLNYLRDLAQNSTDAFVVEDKDMSEGKTTVSGLERLVKKHHIKLLIIDGLSYIAPETKAPNDSIKYKDICTALFKLSKTYGCAVVVAMQANRDTKETKDEKGLPFPTMYEAESSDHPARIATQVFTMRQIFEKHIMDIRLEKSRTAANTRPVFSYSWDPNTGTMEYVENAEDSTNISSTTPSESFSTISSTIPINNTNDIDDFDGLDDDDDDAIEF